MTALRAHAVMRRPMQNTGAMHIPFILITVAPKLFLAIAGRYRQSGRFSRVALLMSYTAFVTYVWAQFAPYSQVLRSRHFAEFLAKAPATGVTASRCLVEDRTEESSNFKILALARRPASAFLQTSLSNLPGLGKLCPKLTSSTGAVGQSR